MDYELLVDDRTEEGKSFIKGLVHAGFDVSIAFWLRPSEDNRWFFYIGSTSLQMMGLGNAYHVVYGVLWQIPHLAEISTSNIKIIDANDPVAKSAIEVRDRYPARLLIHYKGKKLGYLDIEEARIYPRTGPMTRTEVLQTVTGLMSRAGVLAPSQVTLRDGSRFPAVPVGIQMNVPGAIQVVFHDLVTDSDRSIPVDEVVGIL